MNRDRLLELAWQDDHRDARVRLLAWMYLAGGAFCLLAAFVPAHPARRVVPLEIIGCGVVLIAAALFVVGRRFAPWITHILLAGYSVAIGLIAAISVSAAGVVALGPPVIVAAMYSGAFCTSRALLFQFTLAVTAYVVGAAISTTTTDWVFLAVAILAALAVAATLRRLTGQLHLRSATDALTGAWHRTTWMQVARRELARVPGRPAGVALLDLDNFKAVNDEHGHLAGDDLLRSVAQAWIADLRDGELLGRFGGDEFVLLITGATSAQTWDRLGDLQQTHPASWTAGVAQAREGDQLNDLLTRADLDLLAAKRNRAIGTARTVPSNRGATAGSEPDRSRTGPRTLPAEGIQR